MSKQQFDEFGRPIAQQKAEGRGCFFYGCITLIVLLVLLIGGAYFGFKKFADSFVQEYSADAQLQIPHVSQKPGDLADIENRVSYFVAALEKGETPDPLVLSEKDINIYIAKEPYLKDTIYVSLTGDVVKFDISYPLAQFGYSGKYFNAQGSFKGAYKDEQLVINLLSFQIKDQSMSEQAKKQLENENLARDVGRQNPKIAAFLKKLDRIEIQDGKVTLVAKKQGPVV